MENLSHVLFEQRLRSVIIDWYVKDASRNPLVTTVRGLFSNVGLQQMDITHLFAELSQAFDGNTTDPLYEEAMIDLFSIVRYACLISTRAVMSIPVDENHQLAAILYLSEDGTTGNTVLECHAGLRYKGEFVTSEHFKPIAFLTELPEYLHVFCKDKNSINTLVSSIIKTVLTFADLCLMKLPIRPFRTLINSQSY